MAEAGMFRSLRIFNYRIWFIGALVSNVGAWMQRTAQDWVVLTELTDFDAVALGIMSALQFLPALILMPVTGMISDRFDKRHILFVTQGTQGVLAVLLAIVTLSGSVQLWHMYFFAAALGLCTAFDNPARQTFVGYLVEDRMLTNAVALNMTSMHGARMVGPAVAGLTVAAIGAGWAFMINAVSFGALLAALFMMRRDEIRHLDRVSTRPKDFFRGFVYVSKRPDLAALFLMMFVYGLLALNFALFAATLTAVTYEGTAFQLGLVSTGSALGGILGSLLVARTSYPRWRYMAMAPLSFAVFWVLAVSIPNFWLFLIVLPLTGIASQTYMITANTYLQVTTEHAMRGRVMALYQGVSMGTTPIGAPLLGWLISLLGPQLAVGIACGVAGIVTGGIALVYVFSRSSLRMERVPERRRFTITMVPRVRPDEPEAPQASAA